MHGGLRKGQNFEKIIWKVTQFPGFTGFFGEKEHEEFGAF